MNTPPHTALAALVLMALKPAIFYTNLTAHSSQLTAHCSQLTALKIIPQARGLSYLVYDYISSEAPAGRYVNSR